MKKDNNFNITIWSDLLYGTYLGKFSAMFLDLL